MRFLLLAALTLTAISSTAAADTYTISIEAATRDEPATGRVMLFFITETGRGWDRRRPIDGPFFDSPQPIASIAVENLQPGQGVTVDGSTFAFPVPLDQLHGQVRVQALLDLHDNPERSPTAGPGNLFSDVMNIELSRDGEDHVEISLTNVIQPRTLPAERENLKWVEYRSELLSEFYGREVVHRAGVVLPPGYLDEAHARTHWPAVYVVPGYGGRHGAARMYASMFNREDADDALPRAVYIVLDPESPLGHHGFTDSPNHGPRGTALVTEFIPYLQQQFRLVATPEARIITGHSSGGWTSLWVQLTWPEVFGACFSSAPDPIDFRAFQMTNLYEDESVYVTADSAATPSYREAAGEDGHIAMTVRQECLMEHAMHPLGGSGQQWDAWMAMFSPRDPDTGYPKRMFDPRTGVIDKDVVEHWKRCDITRLASEDWDRYGPIITQRVRLACGMRDNYYLQRAVLLFKSLVDERAGEHDGPGYILLHETADHGSLMAYIHQRWNAEMREHFRQHGLHD